MKVRTKTFVFTCVFINPCFCICALSVRKRELLSFGSRVILHCINIIQLSVLCWHILLMLNDILAIINYCVICLAIIVISRSSYGWGRQCGNTSDVTQSSTFSSLVDCQYVTIRPLSIIALSAWHDMNFYEMHLDYNWSQTKLFALIIWNHCQLLHCHISESAELMSDDMNPLSIIAAGDYIWSSSFRNFWVG